MGYYILTTTGLALFRGISLGDINAKHLSLGCFRAPDLFIGYLEAKVVIAGTSIYLISYSAKLIVLCHKHHKSPRNL